MWSKLRNLFRGERLNRDLDEELQSHLEEAATHGRSAQEVRLAFGSALHHREASRDVKLITWLDALRADVVFGWRQLLKNKVPSAAAVLSLALAIGACVSAFRIIDALFLRPLPVSEPGRLRFVAVGTVLHTGEIVRGQAFEYPQFRRLRAVVKDSAELMAISYAARIDLTYGSDDEIEKAYRQYVSGWTFGVFGLKPAVGRLLTANDDRKPGGHPQAVLSYNYWQSRFGGDPQVIGRSFRTGNDTYEIVGVIERGFTGTETGTLTDIFVPTMMNAEAIDDDGSRWFRIWAQLRPDANAEVVRQQLQASLRAYRDERMKARPMQRSKGEVDRYINAPVFLESAAAGVSDLQRNYRQALLVLGVLVALVLVIACVNVANLFTAQAAARAREMALRVSIGAGRWRLVQLVLVESVLLAAIASALGGLFAWRAAPLVVSAINPPHNPARLSLPADWRVLGFAVVLAAAVSVVFGLFPALRASSVKPVNALKGGEDPHARRRLMHALVAAQVAFCFLVHFVAGLFVASFDRLSHQPTGFAVDRLLLLVTGTNAQQPPALWDQVTDHLRTMPGVESAALSDWALMTGSGRNHNIAFNGVMREDYEPYFLGVSPRWLETMRIPLLAGRDFRAEDRHPSVAIVNETFARIFFNGENPIGRTFEIPRLKGARVVVIGLTGDALYHSQREGIRATAYVPVHSESGRESQSGTYIVRTSTDNLEALAPLLRREVTRIRPEFRVSTVRTQTELVELHTIRERLLAALALFFAVVSLLLAAVGLFGVLDYAVQQRRREIGIRIALGARPAHVASRVTVEVFAMVLLGAVAGLGAGVASERYIESLLYQVKATDATMLVLPTMIILGAALLAALPPVIRAVRINPAGMLRAD